MVWKRNCRQVSAGTGHWSCRRKQGKNKRFRHKGKYTPTTPISIAKPERLRTGSDLPDDPAAAAGVAQTGCCWAHSLRRSHQPGRWRSAFDRLRKTR